MPAPGPTRARTAVLLPALALVLAACATLPDPQPRPDTHALTDTGATRLGRAIAAPAAAHPGKAAVHALPSGRDAFATRFALASVAERSIDVQYYIWRADT